MKEGAGVSFVFHLVDTEEEESIYVISLSLPKLLYIYIIFDDSQYLSIAWGPSTSGRRFFKERVFKNDS